MITKISIQNFKSFENANLAFSNLNVFTGLNGMGKSSIIQVLLLLRQSFEKGLLQEGLALNGDLVHIGTVKDALFEFAQKEEVNFKIGFQQGDLEVIKEWNFVREINDPDSVEEERKYSGSDFMPYSSENDSNSLKDLNELTLFSLFKHNAFRYLNAERWVKNEYEISDYNVVRNRSMGKYGQFTAHYLNYFGTKKINSDLMFPDTDINELSFQVSSWMSAISPSTKVVTDNILGSETIKLRYVFEAGKIKTDDIKPLNVGFGITYVLPILVALLSSEKGDILIIENPESHIHPKAQSILGKLITKVANTGVQVFIETHSDHIINGIRVAVKNGISHELVRLFFFSKIIDSDKLYTDFQTPKIDMDGRIDFWPSDFFDEWDNNLMELL